MLGALGLEAVLQMEPQKSQAEGELNGNNEQNIDKVERQPASKILKTTPTVNTEYIFHLDTAVK